MNYHIFLKTFILFFLKLHFLSELNLTKKNESFDEIEIIAVLKKIFLYIYDRQGRGNLHIQICVWPVVISEEWEGENDTERVSEDSDVTIWLGITARFIKASLI